MPDFTQIPLHYITFLTLLPIVGSMIYVLTKKIQHKKVAAFISILLCGSALILNEILVFFRASDMDVHNWLLFAQILFSVTIPPQVYMFFSGQVGRKLNNGTTIALWSVILLLLIPCIGIELRPFAEPTEAYHSLRPMTISVFKAGRHVYEMSMGSLIVLVQGLITMIRVPALMKQLHKYELHFSKTVKNFFIWWIGAMIFIIYSSIIPMEMLEQPLYFGITYGFYAVVVSSIFISMGRHLDLEALVTAEEEHVHLDKFIDENHELADRARRLFLENQLYLQPNLTIDEVVGMLGTNRTYFTRMMRIEFGMSFTEYINNERINKSKQMLLDTTWSLDVIAEKCALGEASSFCRVFKRVTGSTPDTWRKDKKGHHHSKKETVSEENETK